MREEVHQLADDRKMGAFVVEDPEERQAKLAALGARNAEYPPLPWSPCIKVIATGEIHEWSPFFAERSDLCVNCDEQGNTDPAAWQRSPTGPAPRSSEHATTATELPPPPAGLHFFPEQFAPVNGQGDVPPVHLATAVLGVPEGFTQNYAATTAQGSMTSIHNGSARNVTVNEAVQGFFAQNM